MKTYKCVKPLMLKQLFLPPEMDDKVIIRQGDVWWLVRYNKTKNIVVLERQGIQPVKMRCNITIECLNEYFEEV